MLSRSADIASLQHHVCDSDTSSTPCAALHNIQQPGSAKAVPCCQAVAGIQVLQHLALNDVKLLLW